MPPDSSDRDLGEPGARPAPGAPGDLPDGSDARSIGPDSVDVAQGGLYTLDSDQPVPRRGGVIGDDVFTGDTATGVRAPSLASRVDALLAMSDDDEPVDDDAEGTHSVTGIRPLGARPEVDPLDLQLGPAGARDGDELEVTGVKSWPRPHSQPIPEMIEDGPRRTHDHDLDEPVVEFGRAVPAGEVPELIGDAREASEPVTSVAAPIGVDPVEVDELEAEFEPPSSPAAPVAVLAPAARTTDDEFADLDDMIEAEAVPMGSTPPPAAAPTEPPARPTFAPPPMPRLPGGAPPPIPRLPGGAPPPIPRPPPRPLGVPAIPSPPRAVPVVQVPAPVVQVPPPVIQVPVMSTLASTVPAAPEPIADLSEPSIPLDADEVDEISEIHDGDVMLAPVADGMEPSSETATVVPEQPIESLLEIPTVVDRAIAELGEAALEKRAAELSRDLDAATERTEIAGLAYELGELFERRLADEARAVKAFGRALQTDPSLRANLWAIRRVFYRRGLWPNLIKLIDAEMRFARTDLERAELHAEKGLVQADRLGQPVEARATFEQAIALDPTALVPLLQLERLIAQAGDEAALATLWERLADAAERPERVMVYLLALVGYHGERGADGIAAATAILDRAAALGVDDERVAAERLRIAELSGEPDRILAALEGQADLLRARFGPAGLPEGGLGRAAGAPLDRATSLRLRLVAIRRRQAQIARAAAGIGPGVAPTTDAARAHAERAWDFLQQGLALAPGEPILLADLADLAEELGRFDELAELVESWQALEGDPGRALMLSIRRADALVRSGQREQARALFGSLEATAPGFLPITALIERDALGQGDGIALARAYASAADAARLGTTFGPGQAHDPDPASAAALFVAAAEVWAHDAVDSGDGRPDAEARAALEQARLLVPDYPPANQALVALHERAGRIDPAADILEREAAAADPDVRTAALERLARLYRDHGRAADAVKVEQRLLALAPDDVRLAWRVDVGLAEIGDHGARVEHLGALARRDPDPARRGIALTTAARLAEARGDRARAVELHRATLAVWPADRAARAAIIELLRAEGRWDELVSERRAEAAELADGAAACRALREAAWVLEDRLDRPADAALAYGELLDRSPDDAHALAALVRCRAAAGDRDGLIAALEQRVDAATGRAAVTAAIELALAQERAGRVDDALDSYRRAMVSATGDRDVGDAVAAAAMVDLAVARGDTTARVEAMTALAQGATSLGFARALREDIGWLYALVLEDFDQAADAFIAAGAGAADASGPVVAPPRGALLGAALIAARRGDTAEMALAYGRLAQALREGDDSGLAGPTAAALHLRSAALAAASGLGDEVAIRVTAARTAAPDDVGALVVTAEHAPPAEPPRKQDDAAAVVDQLLARAEVFTMRAALADDPAARASWELDRAEALECAGRLKESGTVVTAVLKADANDLRALEALRRLARRGGDRPTWARAALALASRTGDAAAKQSLLREGAAIFDPAADQASVAVAARPDGGPSGGYGADPAAAVAVYKRILVDAPGAPEFARLCQIARQHGDVRTLALAIAERLAWLDGDGNDRGAGVPLLLERARVRSAIGDARGAVADLDDLLGRAPAHPEALRMAADLVLGLGDAQRSVELWRRYLEVETAPDRKADAELTLSRILAENMDDVHGAIAQLERVIATAPHDASHRERLVGLATRAQDWGRVVRELRELTRLRPSPGEKAREELRQAEILRDKVGDRAGARAAVERARALDPLALEPVRDLRDLVGPGERAGVLEAAARDLRHAISQSAARAALHDRLATILGWAGDADGRWLALVALEATGAPSAEQRAALAAGRAHVAPVPRQALDAARKAALRPAEDQSVVGEVWRVITAAVTTAAGIDAAKLGFARGDKVALKQLGKRHEALAAALVTLGVAEADVYISEARNGIARVLSGETPTLCVGADVATGASAAARWQLGRAAYHAADGTGMLSELREGEGAWWVAAALRVAEVTVPAALVEAVAGDDAAVAERVRLLGKHLARKDKKALSGLVGRLREINTPDAVTRWRRAAQGAGHRAGLLFAGDLAVALAMLDVGRGGRALADSPAALDLCAWSVSEAHTALRRALGCAVGGAA